MILKPATVRDALTSAGGCRREPLPDGQVHAAPRRPSLRGERRFSAPPETRGSSTAQAPGGAFSTETLRKLRPEGPRHLREAPARTGRSQRAPARSRSRCRRGPPAPRCRSSAEGRRCRYPPGAAAAATRLLAAIAQHSRSAHRAPGPASRGLRSPGDAAPLGPASASGHRQRRSWAGEHRRRRRRRRRPLLSGEKRPGQRARQQRRGGERSAPRSVPERR